jgi:hypothetical protein
MAGWSKARYPWRTALIATVVAAAACGSDSTGPDPDPNPTNGSMSARIDGVQWTANVGIHAVRASGAIGLAGSDGQMIVALGFVGDAPGVHQIGGASGANGSITTGAGTQMWNAVANICGGTITVTTLNDTRVAGTFSFTAPAVPTSQATGERVVTQGAFDIRF